MITDNKIEALKIQVRDLCNNEEFKHHKWFYQYHLLIVEKLVNELLKIYPQANRGVCQTLIWIHDFGKIIFADDPDKATLIKGEKILQKLNFNRADINLILKYCNSLDSTSDFLSTPLEVQILASADGASHFIGPFFGIYWYENPTKEIPEIMEKQIAKANKDWFKKIVLPEARSAIANRYQMVLEQNSKTTSEKLLKEVAIQ